MIRSLLFGYGCLRKPLLCYAYLRELNGVGPDCVEDILELVDDGDEGLHAVDQLSSDSANKQTYQQNRYRTRAVHSKLRKETKRTPRFTLKATQLNVLNSRGKNSAIKKNI